MKLLCILSAFLISYFGRAQISPICLSQQDLTIVVLGSSTAAGSGPSVSDSAWVNRYRKYLKEINPNNEVINLGVGGTTTYNIMPTNFVPLPGKPLPDPNKNIDNALSYNPDAIIINFPSNDAAFGFGIAEQMSNFDSVVNYAAMQGVPTWVCTTQPKTGFSTSQKAVQTGVRDSILSLYGNMAIDFWTTLALPNHDIDSLYDADGTHLNDAGHAILVSRVIASNIPSSIYIPSSSPDYFVHDLLALSNLGCSSNQGLIGISHANRGTNDLLGYTVNLDLLHLSSGGISSQNQVYTAGLNTCIEDTTYFTINTTLSGWYQVTASINHVNDTTAINDTLIYSIYINETPQVSVTPDTICYGENAQLTANSINADTLLWYSDTLTNIPIAGGTNFNLTNLTSDSTVYVQGATAPFTFLDSINTDQISNINWNGVMFDVIANNSIILDSLSCKLNSVGLQTVEIYYCLGSHLGKETNISAWNLWHTESVNIANPQDLAVFHTPALSISNLDTIGIYIMMQNSGSQVSYTSNTGLQNFTSNSFQVIAGSGSDHNFGGSYYPRVWNGSIYAHHGFNPQGQCSSNFIPVSAILSTPNVFLGDDTTITINDILTLNGGNFTDYIWSDNSTTSTLAINGSLLGIGTYTYTLEVTNSFGCTAQDTIQITVVDPVGIDEFSVEFSLYPNPVNSYTLIQSDQVIDQLQVFTTSGQLIHTNDIHKNNYLLRTETWPAGTYIVRTRINDIVQSKQLIKL